MKQIVTKSTTFAAVLVALERQYLFYETNLSNGPRSKNLAILPSNSKAACISELLANLNDSAGRPTPGSYSSNRLLFWLVAKIPRDVWDELHAKAERQARILTYDDLFVLLLELAPGKESDQHLNAQRPRGGNAGNYGRSYQGPRPAGQGLTPKNAPYMSNVQAPFWRIVVVLAATTKGTGDSTPVVVRHLCPATSVGLLLFGLHREALLLVAVRGMD